MIKKIEEDFKDNNMELDELMSKRNQIASELKEIREDNPNSYLHNDKYIELVNRSRYLNHMIREMNCENIISSRENKVVDTSTLISNIRYLLEKNPNVKIGQIELESKNQLGYMSRIEKSNYQRTPNFEFIVKAAALFDVSIDSLTYTKMNELSETEEYLCKFIRKLIMDIRNDIFVCIKETNKELQNVGIKNYREREANHPLFSVKYEFDGKTDNYFTQYNSLYFKGEEIKVVGNSYNITFDEYHNKLYVMNCKKDDELFFELYIVDANNKAIELCCSYFVKKDIKRVIKDLYKEIETSTSRVHLTEETKNTIDAYLKR